MWITVVRLADFHRDISLAAFVLPQSFLCKICTSKVLARFRVQNVRSFKIDNKSQNQNTVCIEKLG